jgi:effector-binding domain-containing protein
MVLLYRRLAGRRASASAGACPWPRAIAPLPPALVASGPVSYEVRTERAGPRILAAVRAETKPERLSADIVRLLDLVWPVLREQGVSTGHNVVVYYQGDGGSLTIDAGVEALTDFTDRGEVRHASTPSGEAATAAHYGEYSAMSTAYAALESWCRDNGRRPAGVNWEVYGDWDQDPAKLRTDVYVLLDPAGE